jgi:uncharacterized protein (DUF2236 family)
VQTPAPEAQSQPTALSTVTDRINAERIVLLGWSRAILLQMAHPLVAAGVQTHSTFRGGPFTAFHRLHGTVRAMRIIAFGDETARAAAISAIRAIHDRVNGHLSDAAGPWPAGTPYSAHDPALLLWVHCTLIESVLLVYERLVEPLTDVEKDAYCLDSADVAVQIGARADSVPRDWQAMTRHLETELASGRIVVTDAGRRIARAVLHPPLAWLTWPLGALNRIITIGLLPDRVRVEFGYEWTDRDEARFRRALRWLRRVRVWLPLWMAWWPEARVR